MDKMVTNKFQIGIFFIFNLTFVFFFIIETKYKASSCVYLYILFDNAKINITDVLHTVGDL